MRRRGSWVAGLFAALLLVAACGSSTSTSAVPSNTVVFDSEGGSLWPCTFNPFSGDWNYLSFGLSYEPLIYTNALTDKTTPWLATGYTLSNDNKTVTYTIRKGVKWSDGKPFTAADIAFTFNLLKKNPALDLNGVWTVLSSVTQEGNQVVMNFRQPAVPYLYYIGDQTPIVPEHIWSSVSNPVKYLDAKPVGTGPYTVGKCTPQNISYSANGSYWQGKPAIQTVEYPAFASNDPANAYLAAGKANWGAQYIPNIKTYYLQRHKGNHYWFPPTGDTYFIPNTTVYPFTLAPVRQALAYAINRSRATAIGDSNYAPPGNQQMIALPTFKQWYDPSVAQQFPYKYDPQKAISLLEGAGFNRGSDGIFQEPNGTPFSFTVENVGGNSNWVATMQVIQQDLKAVGIQVKVDNLSSDDYASKLATGNFQLAYGGDGEVNGPTPFYEYNSTLNFANSAPIGQSASGDWGRWNDPKTNQFLSEFSSASTMAQQKDLMDQLQMIMASQVPLIPVTEGVAWYEWNTTQISGWVTQTDQYADPGNIPDEEVILLHLKPRG